MAHLELVLLFLLLAVTALTVAAQRLDVPYPILLVIGGVVLALIPGLPRPELHPDLVLLVFLPPLLYDAALRTSRRELRRNVRPIAMDAVGLVLATTVVVAVVVHAAVPDLPWATAFAFGAIVSPTDPLAAVEIARRLGVPRRLISLVEGESLINDGTALTAYASAVAAVAGTFSLLDTGVDLVLNIVAGAAIGLAVGQAVSWVLRQIDDDPLAVTVTLLAGYAGYLPAEELGLSGIIAAVVVGLVLGHRIAEIAGPGARLSATAFWDVLVFLLNAVLFVLVGLQLPAVLEAQDRSAGTLLALGALAGVVVIGVRMAWMHGVPSVIRLVDPRPDRRASRRELTALGWAGLRGAVSLAAALALPAGFPERDLLVWLTLCVIAATLVFQGLTFPFVLRRLRIRADDADEREARVARAAAAGAALERIEALTREPDADREGLERLRRVYADGRPQVGRAVLDAQRERLVALRNAGEISDVTLYTVMRDLDLEDVMVDTPRR